MPQDDFARIAVDEAKKSISEGPGKPNVGVVVVKDGVELGRSHRGRTGSGEHAEFGLLKELQEQGHNLAGSVVYTTLEPCSVRNHPKVPCATHLAAVGVSEVFIGMYDPNPQIYRDGWRRLRDDGVTLRDFPEALRNEIVEDNREFREQFTHRRKDADTGVLFDWDQHPTGFEITTSEGTFTVKFSDCGDDSVYLHSSAGQRIGSPRYAKEFDQVDDPEAQDTWKGHFRRVDEGSIGMLSQPSGYLLVKVVKVHNLQRGADQNCVQFDYEYRPSS